MLKAEADETFEFGANESPSRNGTPTHTAPDPFDVTQLRLAANDDVDLGVKELLVSVPFRKPSKETFFRVHNDPAYQCVGGLIELKEEDAGGDSYWVVPSLWPHLADEPTFRRQQIVTCVTRSGLVFLWGLRLPGTDGKMQDWILVPQEAAKVAKEKWTKLYWDQGQKKHRIKVSDHVTDEPVWPEQSFSELLRLAFKDRLIADSDHPILKRLRGEV